MARYSAELNEEVKKENNKEDPLGKIAEFSKLQGLLGVIGDFSQEVYGKLDEYGIEGIPIDL